MTIVLIRTVILYLIVLFVIRIMGKAELSKMSPFQLIVVFMIAELASIPIESPDVSMITGVAAIFTLMFLQVLISFISLRSEKFKKIFSGRPSVLIDKGEINVKEMRALRITINDLMEQLRIGGAPSINDVDFAVMESNGELSIIQKAEKRPLTAEDASIAADSEVMPSVFISDGIIYYENIRNSGWTTERMLMKLASLGIDDTSSVFLVFCDGKGKLHVYMPDSKRRTASEVGR